MAVAVCPRQPLAAVVAVVAVVAAESAVAVVAPAVEGRHVGRESEGVTMVAVWKRGRPLGRVGVALWHVFVAAVVPVGETMVVSTQPW